MRTTLASRPVAGCNSSCADSATPRHFGLHVAGVVLVGTQHCAGWPLLSHDGAERTRPRARLNNPTERWDDTGCCRVQIVAHRLRNVHRVARHERAFDVFYIADAVLRSLSRRHLRTLYGQPLDDAVAQPCSALVGVLAFVVTVLDGWTSAAVS